MLQYMLTSHATLNILKTIKGRQDSHSNGDNVAWGYISHSTLYIYIYVEIESKLRSFVVALTEANNGGLSPSVVYSAHGLVSLWSSCVLVKEWGEKEGYRKKVKWKTASWKGKRSDWVWRKRETKIEKERPRKNSCRPCTANYLKMQPEKRVIYFPFSTTHTLLDSTQLSPQRPCLQRRQCFLTNMDDPFPYTTYSKILRECPTF